MTPSKRIVRTLLAVVMTGCVVMAVLAGEPPAPVDGQVILIKGTKLDDTKFEGTLKAETVAIRNDYGTMTYRLAKVKSLSFRHTGEEIGTTVELDDHARVQGKLIDATIAAIVNNEPVALEAKNLKILIFVKPVPVSMVAIILGLLTLAMMEIVLGVDNIIFLAILVGKLPEPRQKSARSIGLAAALGTRILLLLSLTWLLGLTRPLFTLPEMPFLVDPEARDISFRDLILFAGGLFLVYKSVGELHGKIKSVDKPADQPKAFVSFAWTIVQIALMDIIFSFDSVITAIGMVEEVWVMVTAMVIAMIVMLGFAGPISRFVEQNPTIKVLALSFLILIGVLLIAESLGQHLDKGYIYFAMAFAVVIELINMKLR